VILFNTKLLKIEISPALQQIQFTATHGILVYLVHAKESVEKVEQKLDLSIANEMMVQYPLMLFVQEQNQKQYNHVVWQLVL
jgi:SAM-dependent MidA family methyltransferase